MIADEAAMGAAVDTTTPVSADATGRAVVGGAGLTVAGGGGRGGVAGTNSVRAETAAGRGAAGASSATAFTMGRSEYSAEGSPNSQPRGALCHEGGDGRCKVGARSVQGW